MKEYLLSQLKEANIPFAPDMVDKLLAYHALLMEYNKVMDLTAVMEDSEIADKHYVDSLSALAIPGLVPENAKGIDVGTGAGFPGCILAIFRPDLQLTLLDAQQKRLTFLQAVKEQLSLANVTLLHARAEDGARTPACREQFDLAVARAVAPMPVLLEYLLPYVKTGGQALCWKGPQALAEENQARKAAHLLGGKLLAPIATPIPGRDWQHLLWPCAKVEKTARQYPRKAGTPSKNPLGADK